MTYSPIGAPTGGTQGGTGIVSIPVNPTAIGNILVVTGETFNGVYGGRLGVSGGGVSSWNVAGNGYIDQPGSAPCIGIFWGIITAVGPSTLTLIGGTTAYVLQGIVQEFNSTAGSSWTLDVFAQGGVVGVDSPALNGNYPSLTPSVDGIYIGNLFAENGGSTSGVGGSSPGYTYQNYWPGPNSRALSVYETNVVAPTAYAPNWYQTTSDYWGTIACILTTSLAPPAPTSQQVMIV